MSSRRGLKVSQAWNPTKTPLITNPLSSSLHLFSLCVWHEVHSSFLFWICCAAALSCRWSSFVRRHYPIILSITDYSWMRHVIWKLFRSDEDVSGSMKEFVSSALMCHWSWRTWKKQNASSSRERGKRQEQQQEDRKNTNTNSYIFLDKFKFFQETESRHIWNSLFIFFYLGAHCKELKKS